VGSTPAARIDSTRSPSIHWIGGASSHGSTAKAVKALMSTSPYSRTVYAPPLSPLARLFRRPDTAGAAAALERLLADAWPSPTRAAVVSVLQAHSVHGEDARRICIALFSKAMAAFADDQAISEEEANQLRVLQTTLGLQPRDVSEAHRQVAETIYGAALAHALDEEDLTPDERARLDSLVSHLRLSSDRRGMLHRQEAHALLRRVLGQASHQQRLLTQQEATAMRTMAEKFGTRIDFGVTTQAHFDHFALLWQIQHGELPAIAVRIKLLKGEICHVYAAARWLEAPEGTTISTARRNAPSVRVNKGTAYDMESHPTARVERDDSVEVDKGTLYITNKRFIFDGPRKQAAIRHSDVVALEAWTDGFLLEKTAGKFPLLAIEGDSAVVTAIAAEALARST
jgi:hypothetical protein